MSDIKNRDEMLKDLQLIKEAARKNNNILKYISVSEGTKTVALFTGILINGLSLVLLWMIGSYGSYQSLPYVFKLLVYGILVLGVIGLVALKANVFLKLVRRYKKDMSFVMLMREIYTKTLLMIIIPFFLTMGVFCVYFAISGLSYLIVPVLAILVSLLMAGFIAVLNLKDYLVFFEWLLLSGLFSLFIAKNTHPLICLILTFGIGMFILYFSTLISLSREKRD